MLISITKQIQNMFYTFEEQFSLTYSGRLVCISCVSKNVLCPGLKKETEKPWLKKTAVKTPLQYCCLFCYFSASPYSPIFSSCIS